MGVPKFYRWISERYPCLSTVAREYQLPEFDNLYLDMNGIIHVCSHPNDADAHFRISEAEIFKNIFDYIDFIFRMIKPKKYFFMAVDGVAPRAKMNQQRDRRFRSAKEAHEMEKAARHKGEELPEEKRFDSNCISPGTEFMERLHEQLKYFVVQKLSTDPVWQQANLKIHLSGHDSPGEGEHKAMDFIRYIRSQKDYDPNTRHCIYGQDADLIMLALCTHEPHIALLREEVVFGKNAQKRIQSADKVTFHLLHVNLLREYLDHEFSELKAPGVLKQPYNLENIIDDWLLMCFLVGNDFLPNLPNLHIAHDALPILHRTYCAVLPTVNGYLHEQGKLNLKNFEAFLKKLGERDQEMFERVEEKHPHGTKKTERTEMEAARKKFPGLDIPDIDSDEDIWEEEFRQHKRHYYMTKMGYPEVTDEVLREQAEGYIRAVQWNLHYYYNGVQSWSWYYPHHYSPFISDIKNFTHLKFDFEPGKPFLPFQQLVSIMPTASKELVPAAYRSLMTSEESPLRDYFPDDFETDLNGKTQEWEAVVLIKYIEEDILLNSMRKYDHLLTDTEKMRNQHGPHLIYEYTSKDLDAYPSPIPGHKSFPDIVTSHAKRTDLPSLKFRLEICDLKKGRLFNTKDSLYFPGFPSLRFLPHRAELVLQGCTIFQQASRGYNMMISLDEKPAEIDVYAKLIGKEIHINYPHLRQAIVTKVCSNAVSVSCSQPKEMSDVEVKDFKQKVDSLQSELRIRWGIHVGDGPKLIVYCKPLIGRKYMFRGNDQVTIEKQWSDSEVPVLHNTIICGLKENRTEISTFKTIDDVFTVNKVVFLQTKNEYGMQATIKSILNDGYLLLESSFREEPNFMDIRKREPELRKNDFLPSFRLARDLGLENHLVARLTGCVQVQLNSQEADTSQTINIGLNLKFNKKNEEVAGYSKRLKVKDGRNEWRFSQKTLVILKELLEKFGDFYTRLRPCFEMDKIPLEKCFGGDEYRPALNRIRELAKWIKEQPCSKAAKQKCGGIVFDEGVVEAIQKCVEDNNQKPLQTISIKAYASKVYLPGLHLGLFAPDPKAYFCMYDRIVNIRPDITIPVGFKGTVIGIHKDDEKVDDREATYDILFDDAFPTGVESLGAVGKRVATLSSVSMINITYGARMNGTDAYHQAFMRQGQGAWTSPAETKVKILSNSNSSRDAPKKLMERNASSSPSSAVVRKLNPVPSPKTSQNKPAQLKSTAKSTAKSTPKLVDAAEQHRLQAASSPQKLTNQNEGDQRKRGGKGDKEPVAQISTEKAAQKKPPQPKEINISVSDLFNEIEGVHADQGANSNCLTKPMNGVPITVEDLFNSLKLTEASVPPLPVVIPSMNNDHADDAATSMKKYVRHHHHTALSKPVHQRTNNDGSPQPQRGHHNALWHLKHRLAAVPPLQEYNRAPVYGSRGYFYGRPGHHGNMHTPVDGVPGPLFGQRYSHHHHPQQQQQQQHHHHPQQQQQQQHHHHPQQQQQQHHHHHHHNDNHEKRPQRKNEEFSRHQKKSGNPCSDPAFIPSQVFLAQGTKSSAKPNSTGPNNVQTSQKETKDNTKKAPLVCQVAPIRGPMWKTEDGQPSSSKAQTTPAATASQTTAKTTTTTTAKTTTTTTAKTTTTTTAKTTTSTAIQVACSETQIKSLKTQSQQSPLVSEEPAVRRRTPKTNRMGALFEKST